MIEWKEFDNPREEIKTIKQLLKDNPDDPSAHFSLAEVYLFERQYDQALKHCYRAIELNPDRTPLYMEFLANLHKRTEDIMVAIDCYERLIEGKDPESEHFIELYELYWAVGDQTKVNELVERMKPYVPPDIYADYKKHTQKP